MSPTDLINIATLGITTGNSWGINYPNLVVNFTTPSEYTAFHTEFRNRLLERQENESKRILAISNLRKANKELATSIKFLKSYLLEEYGKEDAVTHYSEYGLVLENRIYRFPKDNDDRMKKLDTLINTLSAPNNPFQHKKYGLTYWENLRNEHKLNWNLCKTLDGNRSVLAKAIQLDKKKALNWQSRLRQQVKINDKENHKSIWRNLGFQSEKY